MVGVVAALWGLFGSFAVEGLELYDALRRKGQWPWKVDLQTGIRPEAGPAGYAVAEAIRLLIGAGLAWAGAATGQVDGPLGAVCVGVAAPIIIGEISKRIPLEGPAGVRISIPENLPAAPAESEVPAASQNTIDVDIDVAESAEVAELCARILLRGKSSR